MPNPDNDVKREFNKEWFLAFYGGWYMASNNIAHKSYYFLYSHNIIIFCYFSLSNIKTFLSRDLWFLHSINILSLITNLLSIYFPLIIL